MSQFNQKIITSPQKNFDLNLRVNFQSGHVSVGVPQNFRRNNQPYIYASPINQNNNNNFTPISNTINNQNKLFSEQGSIA